MRRSLALAATAAATAAAAAAAPAAPAAPSYAAVTSVLLDDAASVALGARCLDGSPQRVWLSQPPAGSANASKLSVHYMGGGWCTSLPDCAARAYSSECIRGSSNESCYAWNNNPGNEQLNATYQSPWDLYAMPVALGARWAGALLNSDAAANPTTHDWTRLWVQYCDGMSWTGNNDTVTWVAVNGTQRPLYFRGYRNVLATIRRLVADFGGAGLTHVVISGDSAGGLASYLHVDTWASELPHAHVVAAPDSGYFFADAGYPAWPATLEWLVAQGNGTGALNAACVAAAAAAGSPAWRCMLPEQSAPHTAAPLFVVNSRFDPALDSISGGFDQRNASAVARLGDALLASVTAAVLGAHPASNGAFLTSCAQHCGQWGQGQAGGDGVPADFNVTIDGATAARAFDAWYGDVAAGRPPRRALWLQGAGFPCKACCAGGQA